jgi:AcrR family transcriptional regulator
MTAPDSPPTTRPSRRARSERAILDATRALLAEVGVRGLTVEGVAARSGVAKTTIYRRWRDKDELALAAVWNDLASLHAPTDVGDTRAELLAFVEPLVTILRTPLLGGVIRGLASEIAQDRELSSAYREQFIEPRLVQLGEVIARAVERGDLRPDTNVRLTHELLVGPVFYRLMFSGQPLDDDLAARITDAVLRAFAAQ